VVCLQLRLNLNLKTTLDAEILGMSRANPRPGNDGFRLIETRGIFTTHSFHYCATLRPQGSEPQMADPTAWQRGTLAVAACRWAA